MPEAKNRLQWQLVEENFEFDYAVGIKWVMRTLCDRWRTYKYTLRNNHFYPNKSKEDILANPPENVDSIEWAAFVHHYKEENMKKQSEQNAKSQSKLKVLHAGGSKSNARRGRQMEKKYGRPVCRSEVVLSKKDDNYVNAEGKIIVDKISEHLLQDQEHAATLGLPLKILAHPNDAIGKVYGAEYSGRVRGLGGNVCPSAAFGLPRHSSSHANFVGSSDMSHQCVEDLEKHVEITLHRFLQAKFGSELPTFNLDS